MCPQKDFIFKPPEGVIKSEDCLYLSVYAPMEAKVSRKSEVTCIHHVCTWMDGAGKAY
jgi:carboxylesterase type B